MTVHLNVSYRCTLTTAALLSHNYSKGMKSVNDIIGEFIFEVYLNLTTIKRRFKNEQYLVFKQSEKMEMIKTGFSNTLTIHEYQGKQADYIVVLRMSIKKEDIYNSPSHCLVAISRHRKTFRYVAPSMADTIGGYCRKSLTLTRANTRSYLALKGEGDIILREKLPRRLIDHPNVYSCTGKYDLPRVPVIVPVHLLEDEKKFVQNPTVICNTHIKSVQSLQDFYDHILPGNSQYSYEYDPDEVKFSDLDLPMENTMFNSVYKMSQTKHILHDKMKPVL